MANINPAFVQQIFHISKRKWEPNIHHDSQTDDLWARLKVAKWAAFCHPAKLSGCPAHLNKFCSDSAQDIWMGAGPVPEFLHRALNMLAIARAKWGLPSLTPLSPCSTAS